MIGVTGSEGTAGVTGSKGGEGAIVVVILRGGVGLTAGLFWN